MQEMKAIDFLVEKGLVHDDNLNRHWNLQITRDTGIHTLKCLVQAMDDYAKMKVEEALKRGGGYYTDVEYVTGESPSEIIASMFPEKERVKYRFEEPWQRDAFMQSWEKYEKNKAEINESLKK
jgi:hypothetical protein